MVESRDKRIVVHIEPTFCDIVYTATDGMSISSYIRSLILRDLVKRGFLSDDQITKVVVG